MREGCEGPGANRVSTEAKRTPQQPDGIMSCEKPPARPKSIFYLVQKIIYNIDVAFEAYKNDGEYNTKHSAPKVRPVIDPATGLPVEVGGYKNIQNAKDPTRDTER